MLNLSLQMKKKNFIRFFWRCIVTKKILWHKVIVSIQLKKKPDIFFFFICNDILNISKKKHSKLAYKQLKKCFFCSYWQEIFFELIPDVWLAKYASYLHLLVYLKFRIFIVLFHTFILILFIWMLKQPIAFVKYIEKNIMNIKQLK